ncbi:MAG TPA: carboxypeptidase regulatory-like domain-containing protein, partial [Flavisolibacter sp.]|nr:carboxypeptidase regulatory-like domain-containing protein [Flavisolibacter sp.]
MGRRFLLAGLVFLISKGLDAQSLSIKGTIVDQQTKAPLNGATVKLQSVTNAAFAKTMLSDSAGIFVFTPLSRDSFALSVSFVGFNTVTRGIRLDSGDITLTIAVVPNSSSELATVIITSTPPLATQKGDTLQLSASQFKVNPDASAEDLMKKVPGVTVQNGQVQAQGENVQKVTIDGRELFGD